MIEKPIDVLAQFPVRKNKAQKQGFRDCVCNFAESFGYALKVEKGSMGSNNIVIGDAQNADYLITAHYDTPARMLIPNLITPCNGVTFILYQILVTVFMLAIPAVFGLIVYAFSHNFEISYLLAYLMLWVVLIFMMAGPANPSNANDNTSGVVTVLEILRTLPENQRHKVAFVLFDLEELGMIGSASYRKAHKTQTDRQIVLNLDCVGDGNEIVFIPTGKLCRDEQKLRLLCKCVGRFGEKSIAVKNKGFRVYPSDQTQFPFGVGIAAFHSCKGIGLYCSKIHTGRDTVLEITNVNILRAALTSLISGNE